jgi:hypothetical protein
MDKVQEPSNSECYTSLSEPYRLYKRESDCEEICSKTWKIILGAAEELYSEDK